MASVETDWEETVSYSDATRSLIEYLQKQYREFFVEEIESPPAEFLHYNISFFDIYAVVFFTVLWTVLRHLTTKWFFEPLADHYALTPTNQRKMPESAWKFVFFLCAWCYTCYVVILSGKYKFFQKPSTMWNDWTLDQPLPGDIYFIYVSQCGFYFHSLYATLFLDTWRKDALAMMVHHIATLILISFSYSLRCHNIGSLIFLVHDLCDIQMEFAKLNNYFKTQGKKLVKRHEIMSNISFFCFAVTWCVGRLYWFPLRILYSALSNVESMNLVIPYALLMNNLMWILQLLNIYWSWFIFQILYDMTIGQIKHVYDAREYDEEKNLIKKMSSSSSNHKDNTLQNGTVKTNGSCGDRHILNGDVVGVLSQTKKDS